MYSMAGIRSRAINHYIEKNINANLTLCGLHKHLDDLDASAGPLEWCIKDWWANASDNQKNLLRKNSAERFNTIKHWRNAQEATMNTERQDYILDATGADNMEVVVNEYAGHSWIQILHMLDWLFTEDDNGELATAIYDEVD